MSGDAKSQNFRPSDFGSIFFSPYDHITTSVRPHGAEGNLITIGPAIADKSEGVVWVWGLGFGVWGLGCGVWERREKPLFVH